jgi:hypothetical protein
MSRYAWFPLNASAWPYTWSPVGNWSTGNDWADLARPSFPPVSGTVPGPSDNAYVAAGYLFLAPPVPLPPPPQNVEILVTATQSIASLAMGEYQPFAQASTATIDITGASFLVSGAIADHFTVTFPGPVSLDFSGGGFISLAAAAVLDVGTTIDPQITVHFLDASADKVILHGASSATPTAVQAQFTGFAAGDSIDLPNVAFSDAVLTEYNAGNGQLTLSTGTVTDAVLFLPGFSSLADFSLLHDSGTGVEIVTCFVEGTRIRTPEGDVAVEDLRVGDAVTIRDPGTTLDLTLPVGWIGRRRIDLRTHRQPEQASPIRIRRDACADGVPQRDLLVSPEHAIFLDGVLVPARLLRNGTTILQETRLSIVQYLHIELERHAILLAEGLPAESYLDTGNRTLFDNGPATILHPDFNRIAGARSWSQDFCAKLRLDPSVVEPIWRRLADRAAALGFSAPAEAPSEADPELWLELGGKRVPGTTIRPGHHLFALPADIPPGTLRLRSEVARPSDRTPWLNDRRRLGIPVERILLHRGAEITEFPLDHPTLATGWWQAERDGARLWRWTDGNAALPVAGGTQMIEIRTTGAGSSLLGASRAA